MENPWQLTVAAMLSHIGCVAIPDRILTKVHSGLRLGQAERDVFDGHAKVGSDLVRKIPRLEKVAKTIMHQNRLFEQRLSQKESRECLSIPLAARILKVAIDCEDLESQGVPRRDAVARLLKRHGWYAPEVLQALEQLSQAPESKSTEIIPIRALCPGMVLAEDLRNEDGVLLVRNGKEVSEALIYRVRNHFDDSSLSRTIRVLDPST